MAGLTPRKVVVPYDFSKEAREALDRALEIAGEPGRLHVVHVLPHLSTMEPGVLWKTVTDETRTRHVNEALRQEFSDPRYEGMRFHSVVGDAGSEIAKYAAREEADLIVVPSHRRSGFSRWMVGSVTERVVRFAPCPVLVLREQRGEIPH